MWPHKHDLAISYTYTQSHTPALEGLRCRASSKAQCSQCARRAAFNRRHCATGPSGLPNSRLQHCGKWSLSLLNREGGTEEGWRRAREGGQGGGERVRAGDKEWGKSSLFSSMKEGKDERGGGAGEGGAQWLARGSSASARTTLSVFAAVPAVWTDTTMLIKRLHCTVGQWLLKNWFKMRFVICLFQWCWTVPAEMQKSESHLANGPCG